jgi:hypothetical protein
MLKPVYILVLAVISVVVTGCGGLEKAISSPVDIVKIGVPERQAYMG